MAGKSPLRHGAADKQTAENSGSRESGTALAIYKYTPSCHAAPALPCPPKTWGGARNRADRTSDNLSDRQVADLLAAAQCAFETGRVFQRHWTVHYGLAGIQPQGGARFVSRLLDIVAKQARRDGGRMTALWVRECASGKGEHVHILLHLPVGMTLKNRTRRWIKAAGGTWSAGVSKVTEIGGRLSKIEENRGERQLANAANVLCYLLKAASEETGAALGLTRSGTGGRIVGKRCGWTQNLHQVGSRAEPSKFDDNYGLLAERTAGMCLEFNND